VDPAQGAVGGPAGEVAVDGGPGWEVSGQRAPDAAVVDQVADGVDDLPAGVGLGAAAGGLGAGRWWQQGLDQGPLAAGLLVGSSAWSP
jgi:hypothetical protein